MYMPITCYVYFIYLYYRINACVDLIVSGTDLMHALQIQPSGKKNHDKLDSIEHLQESFHHFFQKGSAAERFFSNADQFKDVIKSASSLDKAQVLVTIKARYSSCC